MCERRKLINQYAEGEALPRHFDLVFVPAADERAGGSGETVANN